MKANKINAVARSIRERRNEFNNICAEFRATWAKVYRGELSKAMNDICERLKTDPKNAELKAERYALEQVAAKVKGLNISDEVRDLVRELHDVDKLTFSCLNPDYIRTGLAGTSFVNDSNDICELRKANKEATEKTYEPILRWTEFKVGKYFRLATVRINENK